ncbi:hypothetical protein K438DRAFT_1980972 [Mycena galopus ATCC 62051]|nr:hypothetical protein K438DRAFT_1980972 [Mycena galopus ATCC 62051]
MPPQQLMVNISPAVNPSNVDLAAWGHLHDDIWDRPGRWLIWLEGMADEETADDMDEGLPEETADNVTPNTTEDRLRCTRIRPLVAQPTESAPILVRAQLNGHSTHPVDPASDTDSDCDSLPDLQSVTDESDSDSDSDSASDSDPDRDSIYASPRPVSGHTAADFMHRATIISHPSLGEDESTQ